MYLNKVYIALGTNVGNWKNNFNQAIKLISKKSVIKKFSSIYQSFPFGFVNQNYYYNSAIEVETNLSPFSLLMEMQIIEKRLQKNKKIINGPRKIDIDIIFFNQISLFSSKLKIPHNSAHLRDFVLLPIIELNPYYIHPIKKETISSIYKKLETKYVFKIKRRQKESLIIY